MKIPTICVSAGLLRPKKADTAIARRHRYLNYGLLCLATVLRERGNDVELVHGDFQSPDGIASELAAGGFLSSAEPLLLSLPSYLSLGWAAAFVKCVKTINPDKKLVVGGRWVVQGEGSWILDRLPGVDLGVYGTAENRIEAVITPARWVDIPGTTLTRREWTDNADSHAYLNLAYEVVRNGAEYPPSVEVSRGCGAGCVFCPERDCRLWPLRDPEGLLRAVIGAVQYYNSESITPYFEASSFYPSYAWARRLSELWKSNGLATNWRCEARVDSLDAATLRELSRAGLKVIDLGLESACERQLLAMGKTERPSVYLARASQMLRACYDLGVWAKINILLYPGENHDSISETSEWLERHRRYIKGISAGPLVVYGHTIAAKQYLIEIERKGARPVDSSALVRNGYVALHLSKELDWHEADHLCKEISRRYMTARDYYDLKAFSYFARSYRFADFIADTAMVPVSQLPFSM